jgi:hypothetical protein
MLLPELQTRKIPPGLRRLSLLIWFVSTYAYLHEIVRCEGEYLHPSEEETSGQLVDLPEWVNEIEAARSTPLEVDSQSAGRFARNAISAAKQARGLGTAPGLTDPGSLPVVEVHGYPDKNRLGTGSVQLHTARPQILRAEATQSRQMKQSALLTIIPPQTQLAKAGRNPVCSADHIM